MRPKRRRILIDELQYHLLAVNLLYVGVFLLLFVGLLFGPPTGALLAGNVSPETREDAARLFLALDERVWVPLMLLFLGLTAHSVLVSHRIAGPLYQFRRLFGELRDGRVRVRATLRKRDYLRKEATAFNEMVVSIEARTAALHTQAVELETGVRALRLAIDEGADEQIRRCCDRLGEHAALLRAALRPVTTRDEPAPTTR